MTKPRRDITLGEMQDECDKHTIHRMIINGVCNMKSDCKIWGFCPWGWQQSFAMIDLTDPPRFNEAQMALLKALYASGVVKIAFGATNDLLRCLDEEYNMTAGLFWEKIGLPREELDLAELLGKDAT